MVTADGRVMNLLSPLKKDNTGYDLKNLFIGAEGTLGIITAAVMQLFPKPHAVATALPVCVISTQPLAFSMHVRRRVAAMWSPSS